jgi:two-component system sensor histidine kinase YesM
MIMPLSSSLSQPIVAFESLTRQVQTGNFQGNYPPTRIREISNLSLSFQHMVDRIQSLIGEVEEKEKRKREAELQALQMQIAPHFLYNTLDTLYYMGIEAEAMELSQGIRDLTTLLRNGLNRGREWTSVKREIEHVKSYLSIQKLRYEDKIQYAIDVDPRIESCSVPKLILQPLVENAIYHGIKEKDGSGKIWISVQPDGDRIRFVVRDSGVGMTEQKAALLQDMIESGRTFNEGVGFQNVMERLRLIYGRHFDAKVESEIGTGTKVFLWVRKECEGHAANFSG